MPRKVAPATVNFKDEEERERVLRQAREAELSLGNYFRVEAGLEPLAHGGARQKGGGDEGGGKK